MVDLNLIRLSLVKLRIWNAPDRDSRTHIPSDRPMGSRFTKVGAKKVIFNQENTVGYAQRVITQGQPSH